MDSVALARLGEADQWKLAGHIRELRRALGENHRRTIAVFRQLPAMGRAKFLKLGFAPGNPAGGVVRRILEIGVEAIFVAKTRFEYVELQLADHAHNPLRADQRLEYLRNPFFGEAF